jgi:hypothetical protein
MRGSVGYAVQGSMILVMRRLVHTALGVWFLIVMTMAQGCAGPAQSADANSARDATSSGGANGGSPSQFAYATAPQNFSRSNVPANTHGYVADDGASSALTDYLKLHRLPLVGAQVLRDPNSGARTVVLYGFVGSDLGKSDAQRQAEDFINDAAVDVDNRIRVNPELLTAGGASPEPNDSGTPGSADAQANASMPGVQSYVDQQNQASQVQQYQQQNSITSMSSMLPLIALLGMLSMVSGGSSFSTGPSMGYSPYARSPYGYAPNGYSPYGYSPYNSPYASPGMPPSTFGNPGYGYGGPGGGVTPFGSLPGSPYSSFP